MFKHRLNDLWEEMVKINTQILDHDQKNPLVPSVVQFLEPVSISLSEIIGI